MSGEIAVQDKVAYISGGTSGINLGIARHFADLGASVMVFGRDAAKSAAAAETLRPKAKGRMLGLAADVRDHAAVAGIFAQAAAELGPPDIVIAGAAGNFPAPAAKLSANGFKAVVDIDLMGTFNTFRAGYDLIRRPGVMIAISAPQGTRPRLLQSHVCAAKAGVNMLVKCLAMEWGPENIRVTGISPGPIEGTEGVARLAATPEMKAAWVDRQPLRRMGNLADIAQLAAYMVSPAASFMTGAIVPCDGGSELA